METKHTYDFVEEFMEYLKTDFVERLKKDEQRWGNT
jgi:hypothetical protein